MSADNPKTPDHGSAGTTTASTAQQGSATARSLGLIRCHACELVSEPVGRHPVCPRCGAALHSRKVDSMARSWAYLIAAAILFVPANTYPIMTVSYFGRGEPDTIISGAVHLLLEGDVPIALLVLFASVMVPLAKMFILGYLLVGVKRGGARDALSRTRMYRLLELVGRWSMIDVFVVAILAALVQMGNLATIVAGPGGTAFTAVVVLTMLAAHSFDPRLIWDGAQP